MGIVKSMTSMFGLVPTLLVIFSNSQIWVRYCFVLFHSSTLKDLFQINLLSFM